MTNRGNRNKDIYRDYKKELLKIFNNQINELCNIVIFEILFKVTLLNHMSNNIWENRK